MAARWVDYLSGRLRRRYRASLVHNFARPRATAENDISNHLAAFFTLFPKKISVDRTPPMDPDRTTYFIFIGIIDCASNDIDELEAIVEQVFDAVHDLYVKAGGRNFVLIDIPPINRSPQVTIVRHMSVIFIVAYLPIALASESSDEIEERVKSWNDLLQTQTNEFGTSSKEATFFLFSSHHLLKQVLEDPSELDFSEDDVEAEGADIWEDD